MSPCKALSTIDCSLLLVSLEIKFPSRIIPSGEVFTFPILIYCHETFLIKNVFETLEYDSPVTISTSAGNYKQSMIIIYDSARVIMTKVCIECDYGVANYAFTCLIRLCF